MALDMTLTGSLNGLSALGGQLGPASFSYAMNGSTQFQVKEIPVAPNAVGVVVALPSVGAQKMFYLKTTEDVSVVVNAEPAKTLKAGGVLIVCGGPNVTSLTFDGNTLTTSTVYVVIVGT